MYATDWLETTITAAELLLLIGYDRLRAIKTTGVLLIECDTSLLLLLLLLTREVTTLLKHGRF